MSFVWAQFTTRNEDGDIIEMICRCCCRRLRRIQYSRFMGKKMRLLWRISQWQIMKWLYYSATLLLMYFVMFYVLNTSKSKTADLVSTNTTTKSSKQDRNILYFPKCEDTNCVLTQDKQILFILFLQNNTSLRELSIIRDTWCKEIDQQDILYVLETGGEIGHESMERYLTVQIEERDTLLSAVFQYIKRNNLLEVYPWYFILGSTSVYVRVEKLIDTFTTIDPNQAIAFGLGVSPVEGLCAIEHGMVMSEALIRVVTTCLGYQGEYFMSLGMCLRRFKVNCITDPNAELGIMFSTEISHMNNILAGKSQEIRNVILINTPAPNDIFYLLKTAISQERYFNKQNEIKELDRIENKLTAIIGNGETMDIEKFSELELHKDFWLEVKQSALVSNLTQKPWIKINNELNKEIVKIGETTYRNNKMKMGLSSCNFINIRDLIIEQTFEKRIYYFTILVENKFPNYKFVQIYKEDIRSSEGSIQSISSLDWNSKGAKTAIILILSANTTSEIANNFTENNKRMLAEMKIDYFIIKIAQENHEYEKQILIALLKFKLKDYIIIMITAPVHVPRQLIELSQEMTIKGHQIYIPRWCDSSEDINTMSLHSQDLFRIPTENWVNCNPRDLLLCVKIQIEKSTRLLVLEINEKLCE